MSGHPISCSLDTQVPRTPTQGAGGINGLEVLETICDEAKAGSFRDLRSDGGCEAGAEQQAERAASISAGK
jgi:hypothetical protein